MKNRKDFMVIGVIAGLTAFFALGSPPEPDSVPDSQVVRTVKHDGHWLIMARHGAAFMHHPDCPCRKRQAEAD
jgi:hypothetical protein